MIHYAHQTLFVIRLAITKDGEKVAVKIQYPDVARLFMVVSKQQDKWCSQSTTKAPLQLYRTSQP